MQGASVDEAAEIMQSKLSAHHTIKRVANDESRLHLDWNKDCRRSNVYNRLKTLFQNTGFHWTLRSRKEEADDTQAAADAGRQPAAADAGRQAPAAAGAGRTRGPRKRCLAGKQPTSGQTRGRRKRCQVKAADKEPSIETADVGRKRRKKQSRLERQDKPVASTVTGQPTAGSVAEAVDDLAFKFLAQQQMDPVVLDQAFKGTYEESEDAPEFKFAIQAEYSLKDHMCKADGSIVTVKRFRSTNMPAVMAEILVLQRCKHPNIIRLLDVCSAGDTPRFVFSQFGIRLNKIENLAPVAVTDISSQLLGAIQYLHDISVVHLDIRVANVTVHSSDTGVMPASGKCAHVLLVDLACSRLLRPGCQCPLDFGTRPCNSRAPELLLQGPFTLKTDIWGLGMVLAHMGLGRPLWKSDGGRSILRCALKALGPPSASEMGTLQSYPGWQSCWAAERAQVDWTGKLLWLGDHFPSLVQACLRWTPSHRLSASEALQHSFFTGRGEHADAKSEVGHSDAESGAKSEAQHSDAKSEAGQLVGKQLGQEIAAHVEKEGYIVLPRWVPDSMCQDLVQDIKDHVAHLFSFYEELPYDETCSSLLLGGKLFDKSPDGWLDSGAEPKFGPGKLRAWSSTTGTGRMFEGSFAANPAAVAVQEAVRPLMARMLDLEPDELVRVPERVSVKPAGSKELPPHLDGDREGSYQVIIALCQTLFRIFPGSHEVPLACMGNGRYHQLTKQEMESLREAGVSQTDIEAGPGDVLVMLGGRVVHSSPAVEADRPTRYMAYAHYERPC